MAETEVTNAAAARRCRPRPLKAGRLRPTDVVGAFFLAAVLFLFAAAVAAIVQWLSPWEQGRWLALHLAFVGGLSQLVLGASQFFAGAFLATDPPPRRLVRAQLLGWNAGALLLAIAVPEHSRALIAIAAGGLLAALGIWGAALAAMRRRSLRRSPWATRWYAASAVFFGFGIVAGALLASGEPWSHGNLLGAHMSLNLAGWLGAAIVGTLHTFYPSLTRTQLRFPRLQSLSFAAWALGVAALAGGYGWLIDPLAIAGWSALCLAAAALLANVGGSLRGAPRPLSLSARLVGAAQLFLLAGLVLAAATAIATGPAAALSGTTRMAAASLLVWGWIGLTVAGSLLHLLAVVVRVRDFSQPLPAPRPGRETVLAALAAAGVAGLALSQRLSLHPLGTVALAALLVAYAVLAGRAAALAGQVMRRARPRL